MHTFVDCPRQAPPQLTKPNPGSALAVRDIVDALAKGAAQIPVSEFVANPEQEIPTGDEVTEPPIWTIAVNCGSAKSADTKNGSSDMSNTQGPNPLQIPCQPANTEPGAADGVSVTGEFAANVELQEAPQAMPATDDVTVPAPAPRGRTRTG